MKSISVYLVTVCVAAWLLSACGNPFSDASAEPGSPEAQSIGHLLHLLAREDADAAREAAAHYREHREAHGSGNLLARLLQHDKPEIRRNTARVLAILEADAYGPLRKAADDDIPQVRAEAVKALGASRDPRARFILLLSLKDSSWEVRAEAACALASLGDPSTILHLLPILGDRDEFVRHEAAKAVVDLAPGASDKVQRALREELTPLRGNARLTVATALTLAGSQDGVAVVVRELPHASGMLGVRAVEALAEKFPGLAAEEMRDVLSGKSLDPDILKAIRREFPEFQRSSQ